MNANTLIIKALNPLNIPVSWLEYKGKSKEYIVFNDSLNAPVLYGDDIDIYDEEIIQVHYYTNTDPISNLRKIKKALRNEGFSIVETLITRDSPTGEESGSGYIHCMVKVHIVGESD